MFVVFLIVQFAAVAQDKFAGYYEGVAWTTKTPRGTLNRYTWISLWIYSDGRVELESYDRDGNVIDHASGRVTADGKVSARTDDGSVLSGKIKNSDIRGRITDAGVRGAFQITRYSGL